MGACLWAGVPPVVVWRISRDVSGMGRAVGFPDRDCETGGPSGSGAWGVGPVPSAGVAWLFENWIVDASRHWSFRLVFVLHFIRFRGVFSSWFLCGCFSLV